MQAADKAAITKAAEKVKEAQTAMKDLKPDAKDQAVVDLLRKHTDLLAEALDARGKN